MGPEGGKGGWKKDGLSAEQYAKEIDAYAAEVAKDAYVIGITPFSSGPSKDWTDYNMDPIGPLLSATPPQQPQQGGTVPTFTVGQGVKDLMAKHNDAPKSDEHYVVDANGQTFKSETFGSKGIYQWNKQANETVLIPFG